MKKKIAIATIFALVVGFTPLMASAASRWLITNSHQIKPGAVSYQNLSNGARHRLKGATGPVGPTGSQGVAGPVGPVGPQGVPGVAGSAGVAGPAGPAGPQGVPGANGTNNPLVFGPYATTGDPDSSVCGGNWANDNFTRTYIVTPNSNGSFGVTELFNGTFTTTGATTPNTPCGELAAGITGTFYGDYAMTAPAGSDFNFTASCTATCTTGDFMHTFFSQGIPGNYAWEFYYHTPNNGSWSDTDHGVSGNITTNS